MKYINIDKELIPYEFDISLEGETYTFDIKYNTEYDFFTIDLLKNGEVIVLGEKVVYGSYLFNTSQHRDIPIPTITPIDLSGNTERITYENFNESVFLYLDVI